MVSKEFMEKLKSIGANGKNVTVMFTENDNYQDSINESIKYLVNDRKIPGIFVTVNRPCEARFKELEGIGVNTKMLIMINVGSTSPSEGCVNIPSAKHLTDLAVSISHAIEAIPHEDRFLFFDSLSTYMIYNSPNSVMKFSQFLAGKMRAYNMKGIILSFKKKDYHDLEQFLVSIGDIIIDATKKEEKA